MVVEGKRLLHGPAAPAFFMQRLTATTIHLVLALVTCGTAVMARQPEASADGKAVVDRHPDLVRLSPTEEVWIDRKRKEVVVGGKIALDRGPLEVFACPAGTKEHEAVVATNGSARLVHAALLAVALEPGRPAAFRPEYRPAEGPPVTILMRWRDADGEEHECPAQEWVRSVETGKALDADWVFTGSQFWRDPADGREYYQADGGDLVCVSNFPTAMIDVTIESPQANSDLIFEVFEDRVPPTGTPVDMVLSAKR